MATATKLAPAPAPINPGIFVAAFSEYAKNHKLSATVEAFKQWDVAVNNNQMRNALLAKYGQEALVEIAIDELFRRYFFNRLPKIVANPNATAGSAHPRATMSTSRKGIWLDRVTDGQREYLLDEQQATVARALERLKVLKLSVAKIRAWAHAAVDAWADAQEAA